MEKITVKDNRLYALVYLYDQHTKLFFNVLDGISDTDANNRLGTKANHLAWIAGSILNARFELSRIVGITIKQTSEELFKGYKGIQNDVTYPPLEEYKKDWESISPAFRESLINLSAEQLDGDDPFGMSEGTDEKYTFYDSILFLIDRESYCIGQIALYRRLLGYEAMKYS